ncbi:efflux transporter outer membrane subunit [Phenylobacterium sp.]|uniref:efflux transporter outer membrane subunit n=1 Tax=Phenylobacterium sp. TaxID=1871053 RepID=UPI0035ADF21F
MRSVSLSALIVAAALAGCASTPAADVKGAVGAFPASYAHGGTAATPAPSGDWWAAFGDARLDRVVQEALARNNNLAAAAITVRRAQLQASLATDQLLPHASADGSASTSRQDGQTTRSASASASVSYEADLFGRLGAERNAARWEAKATAQDLEATRLALIGETLTQYWTLGYLNARIASAEASVAYSRQVLALVEAQKAAGAVSGIELNEARQSVQSQEAALSALVQQRVETRNALALLLGGQAWPQDDEPQGLSSGALPGVAEGVPAELLARRPDLRAAELRLRGSLSTVDASRASFYPQITLTGSAGGSSSSLSNVLADPVTALGVGVTLPFLNFNQLSLNLKVSKADYEKAVIDFRQSLLSAFADVDNALSARTQLDIQGQRLAESYASASEAERLYGVRYHAGAVALRTWLDAQESKRSAETALLQNDLSRLQNMSTLYQALGGDTPSS